MLLKIYIFCIVSLCLLVCLSTKDVISTTSQMHLRRKKHLMFLQGYNNCGLTITFMFVTLYLLKKYFQLSQRENYIYNVSLSVNVFCEMDNNATNKVNIFSYLRQHKPLFVLSENTKCLLVYYRFYRVI